MQRNRSGVRSLFLSRLDSPFGMTLRPFRLITCGS